ncbi:MAG: hypothetical protein R3F34_03330 [Planctomycetota bacterium]
MRRALLHGDGCTDTNHAAFLIGTGSTVRDCIATDNTIGIYAAWTSSSRAARR